MFRSKKTQALNNAIDQTNFESFKEAIKKGANINRVDNSGYTPLMNIIMCMSANGTHYEIYQEMIDLLLKNEELNINAKNRDGNTALHLAATFQFCEVVNKLSVCKNIDYSIENKMHETAIQFIQDQGAEHIIRIIENFQAQAKLDAKLIQAMKNQNLERAKALLEKGANVNCQNKHGQTPLHYAVIFCNQEITTVLLNQGANVNQPDKNGKTPLHFIAMNDEEMDEEIEVKEIMRMLIDKGANLYQLDKYGITPLELANACGNRKIMLSLVSNVLNQPKVTLQNESQQRCTLLSCF